LTKEQFSNLEETLFTTEQSESEQDSISYSFVFDTDSSDDKSGYAPLRVTLEQTFSTWEAVGNFLNDMGGKKALVFEEDVLSQKWKMSRAYDYKWRVNRNLSKDTSIITFTTVVDEHNHSIVPSPSTNIAKYRKLGEDIVEFIEFCIHYGVTSAQSIERLLKVKFPGRKVYQRSLYNTIQAAKKKLVIRVEFDASDLMKHLYSQCAEDQRWFIEAKFDGIERWLYGLVWLLPE
ncbi:13037_t:CDS:2, partial [Gigaspora rosea]